MSSMMGSISLKKASGLLIVLIAHTALLWGLWQPPLIPRSTEAERLFVNFIAPPAPERKVERKPPPRPKASETPPPRQLVAETAVVAPADDVAPAPPPAPRIEAPVAPPALPAPPAPAGPVSLATELSAACLERIAPAYPPLSRRLGEEGVVVLHVELDESGAVAQAHVRTSSGFRRLDEAALAAIKGWRCLPAQRNGQPVRASALQPFKFVLQ